MANYSEQLQKIWRDYEEAHGYIPASAREAVKWGASNGMIEVPTIDPFDKLAEDMAKAMREEYGTDANGRRYRKNHAVRVTKGGVQYTMWAIMGNAPRAHMHKAFIQRREQIVSDCVQLATDVMVYNDLNNGVEPIQMVFNFEDDVSERMLVDGLKKAA
jgi:hypothetical protein